MLLLAALPRVREAAAPMRGIPSRRLERDNLLKAFSRLALTLS